MTKNNPPKNITNSSQTPSDTLSGSLKISNNRLPHLIFTRSQNMHLFFVESGLLVLSDTINRLNLVKMLLQSVEKTHETFGDNIEVAAKITFNKLGSNILDVLNSLDVTINVKEDSPFIYNFLFLGAFLKLPVNTTKFFGAIIELLYNELRINMGRNCSLVMDMMSHTS